MKKNILFSLLLCSASVFAAQTSDKKNNEKDNYSNIYASAIKCAKNGGNDCKQLMEDIFKVHWLKRKPFMFSIGASHLKKLLPLKIFKNLL